MICHTFRFIVWFSLISGVTWASGDRPASLVGLASQADVVAIGIVKQIENTASWDQKIELQLTSVLQGTPGSLDIVVNLAHSSGGMFAGGVLTSTATGQKGVWFLKASGTGYQVMPIFENSVRPREVFIPISDAALQPVDSLGIGSQLLQYEVAAYMALSNPSVRDVSQLSSAILEAAPKDAAIAVASLQGSVSLDQHTMGLAISISLGSPAAVMQATDEWDTIKASSKFGILMTAIEGFPAVRSSEAIAAFERLIGLHSDISGFDRAVSSAFLAIGGATTAADSPLPTKAVLPGVVALLDSKDSDTQIRAASFLAFFTLFADANGDMPRTGVAGPLATEATRQFTPSNAAPMAATQYTAFWKAWWAQNRAKFGY